VAFGSETDTLEPSGVVVKEGPLPSRQQVEAVLPQFRGRIQQVPPLYSAIHVDGKRASDVVRSGATAQLPSREITIHSLELLDFDGGYGLLEVTCSKGTYIRSLARDIAVAAGTCAHLVALRRVSVGPFQLENAVFAPRLADFTLASRGYGDLPPSKATAEDLEAVAGHLIQFTPEMARSCGLVPLVLDMGHCKDFFQGRPLRKSWFTAWQDSSSTEYPVFFESGELVGMIKQVGDRLQYGFVIPQQG
jgi:tRNA pseudouridine55 synthase